MFISHIYFMHHNDFRAFSGSESDQGSNGLVTKVAELKRLKTSVNDGPLPGAHTSYIGVNIDM